MNSLRNTTTFRSRFLACALAVGAVATTGVAVAQGGSTMYLKAEIPFAFETGGHQMPAGEYAIRKESDHVLWLKGPGSTTDFVVVNLTSSMRRAPTSKLVFEHSGDKYFLRKIATEGSTEGVECPRDHAEKVYLRAKNEPAPTTVELAANLIPSR